MATTINYSSDAYRIVNDPFRRESVDQLAIEAGATELPVMACAESRMINKGGDLAGLLMMKDGSVIARYSGASGYERFVDIDREAGVKLVDAMKARASDILARGAFSPIKAIAGGEAKNFMRALESASNHQVDFQVNMNHLGKVAMKSRARVAHP